MIDRWHAAGFLLQHWLRQESSHSIHSPGLFRFYTEVVYPKAGNIVDPDIEQLRHALTTGEGPHSLQANMHIPPSPFGPAPSAGSKRRTLKTVVKNESAGAKTGCLLQRLVEFQEAKRILEIGTSAGFTTLYLSANSDSEVITLEGHPVLDDVACGHFQQFNRSNIKVVEGNADITLPEVLANGFQPDVTFIDANHRYEPTCRYVRCVLAHMPKGGVIVIHDIHHSAEMSMAWLDVSGYPEVTTAINLGTTGILLTHPGLHKAQVYW